MQTLIELYDERPLENVLGVDVFRSNRVVYVCPDGTDENSVFGDALFAFSVISALKKADFEEILNKKTAHFIENYTHL